MNKLNFLIVLVILLFLLNCVTIFFLFKTSRHDFKRQGRPDPSLMFKRLELNKEQEKQFEELRTAHFKKRDALREGDEKLKLIMIDMITSGSTDSIKIDSIVSILAVNRKQFELDTYQHFSKLNSLLEPGQKQKFKEVLNHIMTRHSIKK